ncbi:hypothetical protein OG301_39225 (plasmid) [Streptomyces platensis]|uniref:hypothetical protein n=1 Tax=Streptomyces platensis TaxID=58346 RepID=UPI002ED2B367|nr:hypothetical protein OG301_39225 [Streptomyces platensis]
MAATVLVLVGGCSGWSGDGGGKASASPTAAASSPTVMGVDEALARYQEVTAPGCSAEDCTAFMEAKLGAARDLRQALAAEDKEGFAEPIADLRRGEAAADHYGWDNLNARGNSAAVNVPIQRAIVWLRANR